MQTMKHSEGLWHIWEHGSDTDPSCKIANKGAIVAQTCGENDEGNACLIASAPWYRVLALIAADRTGESCIEHVVHHRKNRGEAPAWCVTVEEKRWVWDGGGVDPFGVPVPPPEAMFLEIKKAIESL